MMKNRLRVLVAVLLLLGAVTVYAALPALAFAEIAANALTGFVVRSAGRQVVSSVAVAANDATWVTSWLGWKTASRSLASLVVAGLASDNRPVSYEVPLTPLANADLTRAPQTGQSLYFPAGNSLENFGEMKPGVVDDSIPFFKCETYDDCHSKFLSYVNQFLVYSLHKAGPCSVYSNGTAFVCPVADFSNYQLGVGFKIKPVEATDGIIRLKGDKNSGWELDETDPDVKPADYSNFEYANGLRIKTAKSDLLVYPESSGLQVRYRAISEAGRVVVRDAHLDSALVPNSVTQQEYAGELNDIVNLANPSPGTVPGSSPSTSITFPSDYAREGEVNSGVDKLLYTGNPLPNDPALPEGWTDFGETFQNLTNWTMPDHQSVCPTGNFFALGKNFVFDIHCDIINEHFVVFSYVMLVVWTIGAFFIVMRA